MQFKKLSPDTDWGPERACAQHSKPRPISSIAPLFETRNRAATRFRFCSLFKCFGRETYAVLPAGDRDNADIRSTGP